MHTNMNSSLSLSHTHTLIHDWVIFSFFYPKHYFRVSTGDVKYTGLKMTLRTKRGNIPRYLPERTENVCPHKQFTAALSAIAKRWKQPESIDPMDGETKCVCLATQRNVRGQVQKRRFAPCYNPDEL